MPFQAGQLAGDYEVLDVIGKGGMGRVYRVRNVISNRVEAMKVLLDDVGLDAGLEDRFIAEIRTLARLDHPNIAKLNTAFKVQKQLLMVMEFVEGFDLAQRAKEGAIPLDTALGYIKEVLSALGYAHKHGVVHRDIKPSNIMVTTEGAVKLMDFGIAKSNAEPLLTQPGTTLGSLLYMSPEQVRGEAVDSRSDLYSVGVVLYQLTAGRCPFEGESTYQILDAQLNSPPPPPIQINPSLPVALNEIILTALEKDPVKRFQNADAFRKVLENLPAVQQAGKKQLASGLNASAFFASASTATADSGLSAMPPLGAQPVSQPAPTARSAPAAALPSQPNSLQARRGLRMAIGLAACVCVLGAALVALPHFRQSSKDAKAEVDSHDVTPGTPPAAASVPSSPPADPKPIAGTTAATRQTDNGDIRTAPPAAAAKPTEKTARPSASAKSAPPKQASLETPPAQAPTPATADKQPPPAPAGPSDADLNKVSEELANMHARVEAVGQSLTNLKQQQAAQGVWLRGDMVASESRMNSYFQMAERALQNKDLDAAEKYLDRTEQEVTKLEHFLGR